MSEDQFIAELTKDQDLGVVVYTASAEGDYGDWSEIRAFMSSPEAAARASEEAPAH